MTAVPIQRPHVVERGLFRKRPFAMTSVLPFRPFARYGNTQWPPRHDDIAGSLRAAVGNTPVLRVSDPFTDGDRGFWAKLEGLNPGGIKDRTALHMVERARARGDLRAGARTNGIIHGA